MQVNVIASEAHKSRVILRGDAFLVQLRAQTPEGIDSFVRANVTNVTDIMPLLVTLTRLVLDIDARTK